MLEISNEVGIKADQLAAKLERLDKLKIIQQEPSQRNNPVLYLLHDWEKGGGERHELVKVLKDIGLSHLAKKYMEIIHVLLL